MLPTQLITAASELGVHDLARFAFLTSDSYFIPSPEDTTKSLILSSKVAAQISQLECDSSLEPLHDVREQRAALGAIQLALQSYSSLIPSLPVEILQTIFMDAIDWSSYTDAWLTNSTWWKGHRFVGVEYSPEHERYEFELMQEHERIRHKMSQGYVPHGSRFGDTPQSPWNVSHVCKRWRDIALTTPRLWTYVEVDLNWNIWDERQNWNSLAFLLDLALERAYPHGLDLIITGTKQNSAIKPFIYPLLLRHSHRWHRIFLLDNAHFKDAKEAMPSEFPLLKKVAMYADIFPAETRLPSLETWYSLLPSLRFGESFRRYGAQVSGFSCQMKARSKTPETFIYGLELIATMPMLETLRVSLVEYNYTDSKWPEPRLRIVLPVVRDLSLSIGSAADSSSRTLTLLSTPSLHVLHLLSLDVYGPFVAFINHSGCSLSSLHIDDVCLDGPDLREALRCTPNLEYLHLTFIAVSRAPHWRETRWIGVIDDVTLECLFDPHMTLLPLLRQVSLLNLKEINLGFMFEVLHRRLGNRDISSSSLEYVQMSLPSFELEAEHEETLRFFRCKYRLYVEIGPWNLYYHDSSSDGESEARFTDSGLEWSSSDDGDMAQEINSRFDWDTLLDSEDSTSDYNPSR